jgi:hypothetical protein
MSEIYCVKCREFTNTKPKAGKLVTTSNGRYRLTGICVDCGSKKGVFTNQYGQTTQKTPEEIADAKIKRSERTFKRQCFNIGYDILTSENDIQKCAKACLPPKKRKATKKKEKLD